MAIERYKVNEDIDVPKLFLVLPDGGTRDKISKYEALKLADNYGLDLIQVADADEDKLAICKIADFGKLKYDANKVKKPHVVVTKEIRIGPNISEHDLGVKIKKIKAFLEKGNIVRFCMNCKGYRYANDSALVNKFTDIVKSLDCDFTNIAVTMKDNKKNISSTLKKK